MIIVNQDRDLDLTFPHLEKNVLNPLNADLAFCGAWVNQRSLELRDKFLFDWSDSEPGDWTYALDSLSSNPNSSWRELIEFGELFGSHFLGPAVDGAISGSGAIGHYWRIHLERSIPDEVINEYDWFVITRSDWYWTIPHPFVSDLDENRIYIFSGESYGGINDRHMIIPRRHF